MRSIWNTVLDLIFGPEEIGEEIYIELRERTRHDDYVDAYVKLKRRLDHEPSPREILTELYGKF